VFFSADAYENPVGGDRLREWSRRQPGSPDATHDEDSDILGLTDRMVGCLRDRGYANLEIEYEVLAGEYHGTAPPLNVSHSLRFLFDAPR
jgi:hypothetical protein